MEAVKSKGNATYNIKITSSSTSVSAKELLIKLLKNK